MTILSNIGPNYSVFVSTFHATNLIVRAWNIPKLVEFIESLTQEKDKVVMMGTIKPSKDQYLVTEDSRVDSKGKKKLKIHVSKRGTRTSLKRIPKVPRRTTRRRRTTEK